MIQRFPKIFQNCSEGQTNVPGHFRKFPNIAEDFRGRPEDVLIIHQRIWVQFKRKTLISEKSSVSSLVRIWKIRHLSPGCVSYEFYEWCIYRSTHSCIRCSWIIGIYLHEFTNNEREISIPHDVVECDIENFEFIVGERVRVNPDNSRAMNALTFLLFKFSNIHTKG